MPNKASGLAYSGGAPSTGATAEASLIVRDFPMSLSLSGQATWPAKLPGSVQPIKPGVFRMFVNGVTNAGCALCLGNIAENSWLVFVCRGYPTAVTIRMATARQVPVYVVLDAHDLMGFVPMLRRIHPRARLLICGDDDWHSQDAEGPNPSLRLARLAAQDTPGCDYTRPVFEAATRRERDSSFDHLRLRQGLPAVARQLQVVMSAIQRERASGR